MKRVEGERGNIFRRISRFLTQTQEDCMVVAGTENVVEKAEVVGGG